MKKSRTRKAAATGPRISEVALRADVSTATVSRVLNEPEKVRQQLRDRVNTAIQNLGYIRHGAASALASRRSNTIGAVVPTIDNAIFARSIRALQSHLSGHNYTLLLASSEYDQEREYQEITSLVERGVDGIMLVGEHHHPGVETLLQTKAVPFVNTWSYHQNAKHSCIGFDNYVAARDVATYLVNLGHRRIAVIAGRTQNNDRAGARLKAVRDTLESRGIPLPKGYVTEQVYSIEAGRQAAAQLLKLPEPPSAIICGNDVLALGAFFECQSRGICIPQQCSITGFDDSDLASHITPALTTVRVPSAEMGQAAAQYLLACLGGNVSLLRQKINVELIIRGSTAAPSP